MASGDVYNQLVSCAGTARTNFQPAAGVQIVVTQVFAQNNSTLLRFEMYNGTNFAVFNTAAATTPVPATNAGISTVCKLFIDNTNYISIYNGDLAMNAGFSGLEL